MVEERQLDVEVSWPELGKIRHILRACFVGGVVLEIFSHLFERMLYMS